jgi:hypothetical protein
MRPTAPDTYKSANEPATYDICTPGSAHLGYRSRDYWTPRAMLVAAAVRTRTMPSERSTTASPASGPRAGNETSGHEESCSTTPSHCPNRTGKRALEPKARRSSLSERTPSKGAYIDVPRWGAKAA